MKYWRHIRSVNAVKSYKTSRSGATVSAILTRLTTVTLAGWCTVNYVIWNGIELKRSSILKNRAITNDLTHWDRVTHICVGNLTIIGSDNGLSPGRRQAFIWTNAGILFGPLRTNFSEIVIKVQTFSFTKMHFKMSSGKCRPSCLGLNVLSKGWDWIKHPMWRHKIRPLMDCLVSKRI